MNQFQESLTTSCKDCIFQVLNSQGFQIGCHGQNVQDEELVSYNDPDWHFKHKICQFKRTKDWEKSRNTSVQNLDSLWKSARKEVIPKYSIIKECESAQQALEFYSHCSTHGVKPDTVVVCFKREEEQQKFIKSQDKPQHGCKWSATLIPFEFSIYQAVIPMIKTHFMWFTKDSVLPKQLFQWLDQQINDQGFRFNHISNENNVIISRACYNMHALPLVELIKQTKGYEYNTISRLAKRNMCWTEYSSEKECSSSCCGSTGGCKA